MNNILSENGQTLSNNKEKAKKFNNYFPNVWKNLASLINSTQNINFGEEVVNISLNPTDDTELKELLWNLKTHSAPR